MWKILRDLLRYNREFLAGAILLGIILAMVALSFVSPYQEGAIYAVPPDMEPSWNTGSAPPRAARTCSGP